MSTTEQISDQQNNDVKVCEPLLFCDNCEFYPIIPVHGHFECPRCHMLTKCCEGIALDIDTD